MIFIFANFLTNFFFPPADVEMFKRKFSGGFIDEDRVLSSCTVCSLATCNDRFFAVEAVCEFIWESRFHLFATARVSIFFSFHVVLFCRERMLPREREEREREREREREIEIIFYTVTQLTDTSAEKLYIEIYIHTHTPL